MDAEAERKAFRDALGVIVEGLAKHPEWLRSVLDAVDDGMSTGLRNINRRTSELDMGLRCALGLAAPDRLTAEAKALLNNGVLKALPPEQACSMVEKKARERLSALISANRT